MKYLRVSIAGVVAALMVAAPAVAAGGSTLQSGYAHTPHNVVGAVAPKQVTVSRTVASTSPTVKTTGTLPFTGADLGLFATLAVVLGGLGLLFRRLGTRSN